MLLYLHGFRSGPQSQKVQALAARMAQRGLSDRMWCAQLSPVPFEVIAQVEAQIAACATPPALAGSSLGGFYVTHLAEKHGLRAVVINPFVPHAAFDPTLFLGEHEMLYTPQRFTFNAEHAAQIAALDTPLIRQPENFWLLAEEGDETLDYRHAVRRYAGSRQTVLPGGDHGFTRWEDYLDEVIAFAGLSR
ncbi:YqiA/YcfP family alpha/beta fold hydrolase [Uliginosibacterium sp. 31-16]|uniref:YqiA/YcfP family alpha/beta fold hydrolase n=1 Tax=Uliginosibacterium sp. 31-16 TaxID=3068315 RepID=UPI00273E7E20|nr:YqiA/YcfP family alpha/beta fold hydrolase [Uliginosibacterium sp. 31-16]MDP5239269.1 YqiA/YcfP family alpha/beta fold hydrolase [Uliginosibacterium sp. 31-16]